MKKSILTFLMLLTMAVGAKAQDDTRALGAAIDTIVRVNGVFKKDITNRIVDDIFSKHRSAELAAMIAKSYYNFNEDDKGVRSFHINDTVRAFYFIREAIKIDSSCARAYVVASDILAYQGERERALAWLEAGIKANPSDSSLYKASTEVLFNVAKAEVRKNRDMGVTDMDFLALYKPAVDQLFKLKEKDPKYPLDLELARLYYKMYDKGGVMPFQQIAEHYGKVDIKELNKGDLGAYAMALTYTRQFKTGVEVTEFALKNYQDDHGFNQFHFYSALGLAQAETDAEKQQQLFLAAIAAAEQFFSVADKKKLGTLDYLRYGEAFNGAKQYDKAIDIYNDVLKRPDLSEDDKNTAYSHITSSMGDMVKAMMKARDYKGAADVYGAFFDKRKAEGKLDDVIYGAYANIYMQWSTEFEDIADKETVLMKADQIFAEAQAQSKQNDCLFLLNRWRLRTVLDPNREKALAVPYAQQLISLALSKDNVSDYAYFLTEAYWFMAQYSYFTKKDKKAAIGYLNKLLEYNPTHAQAPKFLEALGVKVGS